METSDKRAHSTLVRVPAPSGRALVRHFGIDAQAGDLPCSRTHALSPCGQAPLSGPCLTLYDTVMARVAGAAINNSNLRSFNSRRKKGHRLSSEKIASIPSLDILKIETLMDIQ